MTDNAQEIRALLAPLADDFVLLPNNVVAEVIAYANPDPYDQGPAWLLGELDWKDWQVPIISFALMSGESKSDPVSTDSRILIVRTLSDSTGVVYVGLLIKGLPRLTRLTPDKLEDRENTSKSPAVYARVGLDDQEALVPELGELAKQVEHAIHAGQVSG